MTEDFFENIAFKTKQPQVGRLLISEPFLSDPYFKRTVILVVEHNEDGTIGFILNRAVDIRLNEVVDDFPKFEADVYFGGPVSQNSLFYLHTLGEKLPDSLQVLPGLYWGGDFDHLRFLVDSGQVKAKQIRFFAGYSGWQKDQLSGELREKSWIVTQSTKDVIMTGTDKELWNSILKNMGGKFEIISNFPEDPTQN